MYIKRVIIENFKCFEGKFTVDLNPNLNILVGDNEVGKSTILEAINLITSGWVNGKYFNRIELNESFFNNKIKSDYLASLNTSAPLPPPNILIEIYFDLDPEEDERIKAIYTGTSNTSRIEASGIQFKISMHNDYKEEYELLLSAARDSEEPIDSFPIEYYDFAWKTFAYNPTSPRVFNKYLQSSFIDSSGSRFSNGSDVYMSRIIRNFLSKKEIINVSQAHRKLKEAFSKHESVGAVNERVQQGDISVKKVRLDVDVSTKTAWENSLVTYLGDVPFENIGKGEQCLIKTKLALSNKRSQEADVLLIEEPENHLSHTKLNSLIQHIVDNGGSKQILISTHSSFVANKLGLGSLIFLSLDPTTMRRYEYRVKSLDPDTQNYFRKLPGYDTLRLILCEKAILVEGDSDELIVQKAYRIKNGGKLPIQDCIDVISVRSLAFKRFLDIAVQLKKPVTVMTDNDGNYTKNITNKYLAYSSYGNIKICASDDLSLPTLEPQIVNAHDDNFSTLLAIFGLKISDYPSKESLIEYMKDNKTDCALSIFDTTEEIVFPKYILESIAV